MTPPPLCEPSGNPEWSLLSLQRPGSVLATKLEHDYWIPYLHATSILPAEGEAPASPTGDDLDGDAEYAYRQVLAEWSCMYGPQSIVDGDPATAWSEGARGAGEGEVVIVHIGDATRLEIWAGFGRSERLHKRNGRPRAIRLYVLQALSGMANQFDLTVGHFVVLARETIELEDVNAYQQLRLPAFTVVSDLEECIDLLQPFFEGEVPEWP
ncbi:MAG: NADase-type glycan-binding domain-containing protein [Spirochaetales bacterium]